MNAKFVAGTVFVDHDSGLCYVHNYIYQTSESAIAAIDAWERILNSYGKTATAYHADNRIFSSNKFTANLKECKQDINFCGVGAHFQNGIAENMIKILISNARTTLLNAILRWPEVIKPTLWPFALKLTQYQRNHLHRNKDSELTTVKTISNTKN